MPTAEPPAPLDYQTPRVIAARPQANGTRAMVGLLACVVAVAAVAVASAQLGPAASRDPKAPAGMWPFLVLLVGVGSVITLITVVRLPAFLALVLAAIGTGLMARVDSLPFLPPDMVQGGPQPSHWTTAVELTTLELGHMTTKIGLIIALAAVIGTFLLESGAADKVVRRCLAIFGEKHAALAILVGTYVVSIPIFFDTIFMLLIPLAKALRLRTGKDYTLYMLAICCPALITHSMVIPHPGPAAMARDLHLHEGTTIIVGWLTGILPLIAGWFTIKWINRRVDVPLVETPGATLADLHAVMNRSEAELPSLLASLAPVLLPVVLISVASFLMPLRTSAGASARWVFDLIEFLGNRHVALLISMVIAGGVLMRRRRMSLRELGALAVPSLELAAVMILITIAGGAFGLMLKDAHVADAIRDAVAGTSVNLVVLAWLVAAVIRIAQGSATVAMLVTSGMMVPMVVDTHTPLPFHPMYVFLAIGYGAMCCSWMNDGGFWVVGKLGGMTERETLRTWTAMTTSISIAGLVTAFTLSKLLPMAMAAGGPVAMTH
jgi:GntP family gluconate:H+ symporter